MSLLSLRKAPAAVVTMPAQPCVGGFDFDAIYEANLTYIWRAARRLGIDPADTDDVVQEVFLVAHRRLSDFEGRAQVKTWLFKILVRVVRHYFRTQKRKPGHRPTESPQDLDGLRVPSDGPAEVAERAEAVRILDRLLSRMDEDKREVFVLAEIEALSVVEIADVLGVNLNTVYSRLRTARQTFQRALERFHTHELRSEP
jgi:RNA polymerase sigma-70 factor (ECF subfamily)